MVLSPVSHDAWTNHPSLRMQVTGKIYLANGLARLKGKQRRQRDDTLPEILQLQILILAVLIVVKVDNRNADGRKFEHADELADRNRATHGPDADRFLSPGPLDRLGHGHRYRQIHVGA